MNQVALSPSRRKAVTLLKSFVLFAVLSAMVWLTWFAFNPAKFVPNTTFTLLSGQKISTTQLKGKVYVVNFWATSCSSCIKEMPQLINTYNKFRGREFELIAVAMSYDTPIYVANYVQTHQLPFKVALDDGLVGKDFGNVQLTPTMFVIDKKGHVLKRYVGPPNFDELNNLLESELAKQA